MSARQKYSAPTARATHKSELYNAENVVVSYRNLTNPATKKKIIMLLANGWINSNDKKQSNTKNSV